MPLAISASMSAIDTLLPSAVVYTLLLSVVYMSFCSLVVVVVVVVVLCAVLVD